MLDGREWLFLWRPRFRFSQDRFRFSYRGFTDRLTTAAGFCEFAIFIARMQRFVPFEIDRALENVGKG
jgi:hypothetical protein